MDHWGYAPFGWYAAEAAFAGVFAACSVVALIKWRASAAGMLALAGFGLLFFVQAWRMSLQGGLIPPSEFVFQFPGIARAGAWILILLSFILAPGRTAATTTAPGDATPADDGPPLPVPTRRPGWGLAATWITISSFGMLGGIVVLVLFLAAGRYVSDNELVAILVAAIPCILLSIAGSVIYLVWLYTTWDAVPAPFRGTTTPGTAVGFLFIPFFNFYWVFRAVPGLSSALARSLRAVGETGGAGYGIGMTAAVLAVIPYVNLLSWPFFLAWVCMANSAKNRLLSRLLARAEKADDAAPGA